MDALPLHQQATATIARPVNEVFTFLDVHENLSAHMSKPSPWMGGGSMRTTIDAGQGRAIGSVIRLEGQVFGFSLRVAEVVVERVPPYRKIWETLGLPTLLIIGRYRMAFQLKAVSAHATQMTLTIDYALPSSGIARLLGFCFASIYARWCVNRMVSDTLANFAGTSARC